MYAPNTPPQTRISYVANLRCRKLYRIVLFRLFFRLVFSDSDLYFLNCILPICISRAVFSDFIFRFVFPDLYFCVSYFPTCTFPTYIFRFVFSDLNFQFCISELYFPFCIYIITFPDFYFPMCIFPMYISRLVSSDFYLSIFISRLVFSNL